MHINAPNPMLNWGSVSAFDVEGRRGNVDFKGMHISMHISKYKISWDSYMLIFCFRERYQ